MKYCNKPRITEATQWFPGVEHPGVYTEEVWAEIGSRTPGVPSQRCRQADAHYVVTAHGVKMWINPGEWIVDEADGLHHRVVSEDTFQMLYESDQ